MISVDQALRIILSQSKALGDETLALADGLGRVLAKDIYSDFDIPGLDNSAMDGYALKSEDIRDASKTNPKVLDVIEEVRAGFIPKKTVGQKQAAKIMTGAALPSGADSVVMVEDTQSQGQNAVKVFNQVQPGKNVRKRGEDIKKGELIITRGTYLSPAAMGVLASLGRPKVAVVKKPKVAILATGNEVIDIGDAFEDGKIYSSNSYSLYSQVIKSGGRPKNLGIVPDDSFRIKEKISQGLDCDLILTSGGVSIGEYDLVKSVLLKMGADIKFHKVAVRPGKPLLFGLISGKPIFGLPGNPVSSMVAFEVFVKPAIFKALGRGLDYHKGFEAIVEEDLKKKKGFRYFVRAKTVWKNGTYYTGTTGPQGSGILKSMLLANSLMVLSEDAESIPKGSKVRVRFLPR